MFRSVGGGICDCGDITVMNSNGFCKHHGPNRIPNERTPPKLIRCAQILLPRLMLIYRIISLVAPTDDANNHIECCICQSKDDEHPLGLVVRLIDTGGKIFPCRNMYINSLTRIEQFSAFEK